MSCVVCGSRPKDDQRALSYHLFPLKSDILCKIWTEFVGRENKWIPTNSSRICSVHFLDSDFEKTNGKARLKDLAVPTVRKLGVPVKLPNGKILAIDKSTPTKVPMVLVPVETFHKLQEREKELTMTIEKLKNDFKKAELRHEERLLKQQEIQITSARDLTKFEREHEATIKEIERQHRLEIRKLRSELEDAFTFEDLENKGGMLLREIVQRALDSKRHHCNEKLQNFAITLSSCSAKGYNYLREQLNKLLPTTRTIRRWLGEIEAKPGYIQESLTKLKMLQDNSKYPLICSLMFDEVHIRNQLQIDSEGMQVGWTDYGEVDFPNPKTSLATSAMFVSAVALNSQWKIPFGYFLTCGLPTELMYRIVRLSLEKIVPAGFHAIAVVFDGLPSNIAAVEKLGAHIDPRYMCSWFPHPLEKTKNVYVIPDIPHMWKLMRNLWTNPQCDGVLLDRDDNKLKWSVIERLHKLQQKPHHHIQFENKKMNVALATQLFSQSVSKAIRFCNEVEETRLNGFSNEDALPLADYLDLLDRGFDALNGRHPSETGRKAPLSIKNDQIWRNLFKELRHCLLGLKTSSGKLLVDSKLKTGPVGIITTITSIERIMDELVCCKNPKLRYLLPYKLCQDHLELMFSSLRACCGSNNNPNALQLKGAVRRILSGSIEPSLFGNCLPLDTTEIPSMRGQRTSFFEVGDIDDVIEESEDSEIDPCTFDYHTLTQYTTCVTTYIAGYVVRSLSKKLKCNTCVLSLLETDSSEIQSVDYTLIRTKQSGGLINPSRDVIVICKTTESIIRGFQNRETNQMSLPKILAACTNQCVEMEYHHRMFHHHLTTYSDDYFDSHILGLIKLVIQEYSKIRVHHFCKEWSRNKKAVSVRQVNTRGTIFQGM